MNDQHREHAIRAAIATAAGIGRWDLEERRRRARSVVIDLDEPADVFLAAWPDVAVRIPVDQVARLVAAYEDDRAARVN